MPPGGGRKDTDPEEEELKYKVLTLHCFSRNRKAQLYHPVIGTALHSSVGWGEWGHCGHGWRDVMLSHETHRLPETRRSTDYHKSFWVHSLRGLVDLHPLDCERL